MERPVKRDSQELSGGQRKNANVIGFVDEAHLGHLCVAAANKSHMTNDPRVLGKPCREGHGATGRRSQRGQVLVTLVDVENVFTLRGLMRLRDHEQWPMHSH